MSTNSSKFRESHLVPAPTHEQSIIGVILRAITDCTIISIQLLMSGGSTQTHTPKPPHKPRHYYES